MAEDYIGFAFQFQHPSWRHVPNRIAYVASNLHIFVNIADNRFKFSRHALKR